MVNGLKNIVKVLIFLFFLSLCTCTTFNEFLYGKRHMIAQQQSLVVDLTIQCEKGFKESCGKLPGAKAELEEYLK